MEEATVTTVAMNVAVYLGILAGGVPIVWGVSEVLGKLLKVNELAIAVLTGPMIAVFFLLFGWLPKLPTILEGEPTVDLVVNILFAVIMGLASTAGAKYLNDRQLKPRGIKLTGK